ncbi:hypothetical protein LCGC14_3039910 [marine sediment metagenome]|uniref:Uncharacterized protein n=1 Tax=marine sediment metagenome TaxID=412755 RepID=A0A0F8YXZ3_9ZZZZ
MDKPRKQYAVLAVEEWSALTEDGRPIQINFKPGMPVGFLPVFDVREDAETWAEKCGAVVIETQGIRCEA